MLEAVGFIIRAKKPSDGAVVFFRVEGAGSPPGAIECLDADLGFGAAPDEPADDKLVLGAMLVLDGFFGGSVSSCFAFEDAVGAVNREGSSTGVLRAAVWLVSFFDSGSCFAAEAAVGAVRCEGKGTGRVGDFSPGNAAWLVSFLGSGSCFAADAAVGAVRCEGKGTGRVGDFGLAGAALWGGVLWFVLVLGDCDNLEDLDESLAKVGDFTDEDCGARIDVDRFGGLGTVVFVFGAGFESGLCALEAPFIEGREARVLNQ